MINFFAKWLNSVLNDQILYQIVISLLMCQFLY